MLDELKDIDRELDRIKRRVRRMIELLEKRRVRLSTLSDEELIGEVSARTMPAADIAKLLAEAEKPKKGRKR
jgi:hypothetical protein